MPTTSRPAMPPSSSVCCAAGAAVSARRISPSSPGACSARTSGTARATTRQPGQDDGRLLERQRGRDRRPGVCDLGIGTDTGCSIRLPAAACEIVGLKTRHGSVPIDGVFPLCPSFDTVGPLGRSVSDVAALWSVIADGPCPSRGSRVWTVGLLRRAPNLGGRTRDGGERRGGGVGRPTRGARSPRRRGRGARAARGHVAGVPPRGGPLARCDVPEPRRRVRGGDQGEARGSPTGSPPMPFSTAIAPCSTGAGSSPTSIST